MSQKEILQQHRALTALSRKYPDRYVAMQGKRILAIGKSQSAVLKKIKQLKRDEKETIGLYYLPGKKKHLFCFDDKHFRLSLTRL